MFKYINIYFLDFAENKYSRYVEFRMYASVESCFTTLPNLFDTLGLDDQSQVQRLPF